MTHAMGPSEHSLDGTSEKRPETSTLLPRPTTSRDPPASLSSRLKPLLCILLVLVVTKRQIASSSPSTTVNDLDLCPQYPALAPPPHAADANINLIRSPAYLSRSVELLSGLVQIPTPSFDDNGPVTGPDRDPRWDQFPIFSAQLEKSFPLLHAKLELSHVNEHGLLFTWAGSDPSLKPSMLIAHQDVVPVDPSTKDEWTFPPFSGHYDEKSNSVWGRGSVDCKDVLGGILEAVELLVEKDWTPRRTILLAFGFDEESKGVDGAGQLFEEVERRYGEDGIAFLLDEGGLGVSVNFLGRPMALPGTGEKGYMDLTITLHTPGGHSSIPPPHTGIGIMSSLIHNLESTPFEPGLSSTSPIFNLLQCAAAHGKLDKSLKSAVLEGSQKGKKGEKGRKRLAHLYAAQGRESRYLVMTSQAVDVISGGIKVNALPETVTAVVNYRISVDESIQFVKDRVLKHVGRLAKLHNLDVEAFGSTWRNASASSSSIARGGLLRLSTGTAEISPAPNSPIDAPSWKILAQSIRQTFKDQYPDLVVAPAMDTGNTDSSFYLRLTRNVYRFSPTDPIANERIHTVDEHVNMDDHLNGVVFYHELLRNADAAEM
ncbi:BQ2448_3120 [Microbotryum intermedium]|uniref:BQ2448_3120 protein n=1 Tax=Microbotryum intermedium TaxID=269621 RepID=A0A238FCH5_9BASI|nr:BQ2448_3120 [Microbotryum intermedium]